MRPERGKLRKARTRPVLIPYQMPAQQAYHLPGLIPKKGPQEVHYACEIV